MNLENNNEDKTVSKQTPQEIVEQAIDKAKASSRSTGTDELRGFWNDKHDRDCRAGRPMETLDASTLFTQRPCRD